MARLPMDIEQEVTGADGRTYGVGSTEILTDAQKDEIGQTIGGMSEEAIPAEQNMGLDSMSNMPMMSEEEKRVFMELLERGIPEDMIIDIMASAKVGATIPSTAVNPAEFGGLPNPSSPDGSPSMTNPQTGNPETMNQNDMAMYLQNKVADIRSRTGGSPQGGVNPAIPNNPKMGALPQPPNQRPTMTRDPYGADTTSSPFGNSMNKPMNT